MFTIFNVLSALPWRLIGAAGIALVLFAGGYRYGEQHATAKWDAEKVAQARVVAKQAEQVAAITTHQTTINQEISNDFESEKANIVADRRNLLARVPRRVRHHAATNSGTVPEVPVVAVGTDATSGDVVLAAGQQTNPAVCEKLAEDAAQTTLMVVEFQRWYREQAGAFNAPPK